MFLKKTVSGREMHSSLSNSLVSDYFQSSNYLKGVGPHLNLLGVIELLLKTHVFTMRKTPGIDTDHPFRESKYS